jgi:hypothetical protein
MNRALALARSYGVTVRFADLGEWGGAELRSEYDPAVPEIRLNVRVAQRLALEPLAEFITLAIGHELYHHRERIGEERILSSRAARERAADDFARRLSERFA